MSVYIVASEFFICKFVVLKNSHYQLHFPNHTIINSLYVHLVNKKKESRDIENKIIKRGKIIHKRI